MAVGKRGRYVGLTGSLSIATTSIIILMTFFLVNPSNLPADGYMGSVRIFTDENILRRVPNFFLLLAAIVLFCQCFGMVIIAVNYKKLMSTPVDTSVSRSCKEVPTEITVLVEKTQTQCQTSHKGDHHKDPPYPEATLEVEERSPEPDSPGTTTPPIPHDYSPKQVLKLKLFWAYMAGLLLAGHALFIFLNLYKQYGQEHVKHDDILTFAGSVGMVCSSFFRAITGLTVERVGAKCTVVCMMSMVSFGMAVIPAVFYFYSILYAVVIPVELAFQSAYFDLLFLMTYDLFGPSHVSSNLGLAMCADVVLYFLEPLGVPVFIQRCGMDTLFSTASGAAFLAALCLLTLPDRSKSRDSM